VPIDLRPLSLGELLDRAFTLYRRHFWLLVGITAVPSAFGLVIALSVVSLQYALGTGFRLGNRLDVDAVVNQDFSFTGSWGASGNSETPFSSLSMTYRF